MGSDKVAWALVTGASSGMGADFARQLADRGYGLILTARRRPEMEALAAEIRAARSGARIEILEADLARPESLDNLLRAAQGFDVEVLVNNAGFGAYGSFEALPDAAEATMIGVDVMALIRLTKAFAPPMRGRGRGYILQTASIGAFQPCPLYASYGAAKAYVLSYGLAVREELRGSGVSVTVLCPGVTRTGFFSAAKQEELSPFQKAGMQESPRVVRGALAALFRGKPVYVPGLMNRVNAFMTRLAPRTLAASIARGLIEKRG